MSIMRLTIQVFTDSGVQVYHGSFDRFPITIGRSAESDVLLSQPSVSRSHFVVEQLQNSGGWQIRNLSSSQGSSIDGRNFSEAVIGLTTETLVRSAGLNFKFIPKDAAQEETWIMDLSEPVLQQHHGRLAWPSRPRPRMAAAVASICILAGGIWAWKARFGGAKTESQIIQSVRAGIFEVVYPKEEDDFVKYKTPLPVEKLSFKERNDKFASIGTAFYLGEGRFVSAAHVFDTDNARAPRDYFLRDSAGGTFKVTQVTGLSNRLDLITFTVEALPPKVQQLKLGASVTIGETVYTAGNALGEGIALRSGVLSSQTPETFDGRWNYLRYSAPASPGNSGGPLLNSRAEVIGVVVMKSGDENLNYGVPIELLKDLPADRAEYAYKGLTESESGLKLTDDRWSLSQPLPKTLEELNLAAARGYDEERMKLRRRFEEKYGAQLFPRDPALEAFVIEAQFSRGGGFLELDKDESGKWSASEPEGKVKSLNEQGSLWFNAAQSKRRVQVDATYYFPKEKVVGDYFHEPRKLFELIVSELSWNRSFAGETVMIQSYGDPHETEKWMDSLGRKWVSWIWRTKFDSKSHILSCLPFPGNIACRWHYSPRDSEVLQRHYFKLGAGRLLRSHYSGSYAQWRSFLELGDQWIPDSVARAEVELKSSGGKMFASLESRGQRFEFSHPADPNHILSLGYLWSPRNPETLELSNIQFAEQTDRSGGHHQYLLLHEPSAKGGQVYKDLWKRVATRSAPFHGVKVVANDNAQVSTALPAANIPGDNAVWMASCRIPVTQPLAEQSRFLDRCRQGWAEGRTATTVSRTPASR